MLATKDVSTNTTTNLLLLFSSSSSSSLLPLSFGPLFLCTRPPTPDLKKQRRRIPTHHPKQIPGKIKKKTKTPPERKGGGEKYFFNKQRTSEAQQQEVRESCRFGCEKTGVNSCTTRA
jgi:hypothetical protein